MVLLPLASIWFLLGTALSQTFNMTIDSATCIAPIDYNTCYATAVAGEATCMTIAGDNVDAQQGCGCAAFVEEMNCFASACWNRIYGCEYQSIVAYYFALCPIASTPVPYWPAPDNAPGGCSCNTGKILETYLAAEVQGVKCLQNATSMENLNNLNYISQMDIACSCCATGVTISGIYDICPNTDPKLVGLDQILSAVAPTLPWPSCGPTFQQFDCVNDLHFEAPLSTGTVYNPTDLPASGTQTLSNIAGEVSSPASGAVFTYSAVGSEWTVSALSINGKQATTTEKSVAGSVAATQSGSVAATQGGSGSTSVGSTAATGTPASSNSPGSGTLTTKKSGVGKIEFGLLPLVAAIILCGVMLTL